jgi:dTDP-4-amino-4,6-dideoxygalactose transaminase
MKVPFLSLRESHAELKEELDSAYQRVMSNGHFILGPETEAFEREFAQYCGSKYCVGVSNGLDALVLILRALEIGPGDEVLVPSNTFIATWLAVSLVGATPVPVDPEPGTPNIDPAQLANKMTAKTKAVMAVHLYGCPAAMDRIEEFAKRNSLWVIEDAAQAQGAEFKGKRCGNMSAAAGFSFYPGKNLGALGDAGAITTSNPEMLEKLRMLRNYGSTRKYVHEVMGYNNRLDEMQSAFLRVKLRVLDEGNDRRRKIAQHYLTELSGLPLQLPIYAKEYVSAWHLFVIESDVRDRLQKSLEERGVGTLVHYPIPPLEQGAYVHLKGAFHSSFQAHKNLLSLPIWPHMTDEMVQYVCDSIKLFYK